MKKENQLTSIVDKLNKNEHLTPEEKKQLQESIDAFVACLRLTLETNQSLTEEQKRLCDSMLSKASTGKISCKQVVKYAWRMFQLYKLYDFFDDDNIDP